MNTRLGPGHKQTAMGASLVERMVELPKRKIAIAPGFRFERQHFVAYGPLRPTTPGHFYEIGSFRL
jgi:hypothetical protein